MALYVEVALKKAQEVKKYLVQNELFDKDYVFHKSGEHIFFPIVKKGCIKKKFPFVEFAEIRNAKKDRMSTNMKDVLSDKLTEEEMKILRTSFDIVGSIAILEIPDELLDKEKLVAETLLKIQKNVKTVVKKAGIHSTEFRLQPMQYLTGVDTKETIHTEHGVRIKLDVEQVYFSSRLSTERERVAKQVKTGESVLVMFSGCAPYPCVIAKKSKAKDIIGVELNPVGHKYGLENIKLNKLKNVELFQGDVRDVVPALKRKFDRIAMPLPKSAEDFLDIALSASKSGTIIHFYAFEAEEDFKKVHDKILAACKRNKLQCEILSTVKCGQHAPRVFRVCVDFKVL